MNLTNKNMLLSSERNKKLLLLCNGGGLCGLATSKWVEVKVLPAKRRLLGFLKVPLQLFPRPEPGALGVDDDRVPGRPALSRKHLENKNI